ncbi:glutaminyl-peptide cyclotransferase-like [Callorhinchus milii]|nr:glutaminyl-peptide cyclotransferase-like [Callorhinchus milii]
MAGARARGWPGPGSLVLGCVACLILLIALYLSPQEPEAGPGLEPGLEPGERRDWRQEQLHHKAKRLADSKVRHFASLTDVQRLWSDFLEPMLIVRYPGSEGIKRVRQHIVERIRSLGAGWQLEFDTFEAETPLGARTFSNLVATLAPGAPRRLALACHYDSKFFGSDSGFVGATDSAVPCAIILELATALNTQLHRLLNKDSELTLQLVFFDGEEALVEWTPTDSLYGSRHLAERMANTSHLHGNTGTTLIDSLDLFVLLDLLGAPEPFFLNHFRSSSRWFNRLLNIEKRLHKLGELQQHPLELTYFNRELYYGPVEDDHIPFLQKGVPVLHLIATPFPQVWHTVEDTAERLHTPTIHNLCKILTIFLAEYLHL